MPRRSVSYEISQGESGIVFQSDRKDLGIETPSRTEMKNKSLRWQRLGHEIVRLLKMKQINELPLDSRAIDALNEAARIPSYAARNRQIKLAARMMEDLSENFETTSQEVRATALKWGIQIPAS